MSRTAMSRSVVTWALKGSAIRPVVGRTRPRTWRTEQRELQSRAVLSQSAARMSASTRTLSRAAGTGAGGPRRWCAVPASLSGRRGGQARVAARCDDSLSGGRWVGRVYRPGDRRGCAGRGCRRFVRCAGGRQTVGASRARGDAVVLEPRTRGEARARGARGGGVAGECRVADRPVGRVGVTAPACPTARANVRVALGWGLSMPSTLNP
jgi:hypothetical protein